ncbi:hypothetical protein LINPERHAP2_LOCUS26957 [Linum perenne]
MGSFHGPGGKGILRVRVWK